VTNQQLESILVNSDPWSKPDQADQVIRDLVAEVRNLRDLLSSAHGYVKSDSYCSCDDSPPFPCPFARALL
jgi:hypothetical protein